MANGAETFNYSLSGMSEQTVPFGGTVARFKVRNKGQQVLFVETKTTGGSYDSDPSVVLSGKMETFELATDEIKVYSEGTKASIVAIFSDAVSGSSSSISQGFDGLMVSVYGDSDLEVCRGKLPSDDETETIEVSSKLNLDATTTGANGLDTGSLAASTHYSLYAISGEGESTALLLVKEGDSPTMPSGYTKTAWLGSVTTDSSADFIKKTITSSSLRERTSLFHEDSGTVLEILTSGSSSEAALAVSSLVPPKSLKLKLLLSAVGGTESFVKEGQAPTLEEESPIGSPSFTAPVLSFTDDETEGGCIDPTFFRIDVGTVLGSSNIMTTGAIAEGDMDGTSPNRSYNFETEGDPNFWEPEYDKDVFFRIWAFTSACGWRQHDLQVTIPGTKRAFNQAIRSSVLTILPGEVIAELPNISNNAISYGTDGALSVSVLGYSEVK